MKRSTAEILCRSNRPGCWRHTADSVAGLSLVPPPTSPLQQGWRHAEAACRGDPPGPDQACTLCTLARMCHRPGAAECAAVAGDSRCARLLPLGQLLQPGSGVRAALQRGRPAGQGRMVKRLPCFPATRARPGIASLLTPVGFLEAPPSCPDYFDGFILAQCSGVCRPAAILACERHLAVPRKRLLGARGVHM